MPESHSHASAHTDRLHHHRAKVSDRRRTLNRAAHEAAARGYAANGQSDTTTAPLGPGNGERNGNN